MTRRYAPLLALVAVVCATAPALPSWRPAAMPWWRPASAGLSAQQPRASTDGRLWQHRNLGKAFYENPTTQQQAVEEFRKALGLAPDSPRERINYGLALLRAGKTKEGIAELEKAQKQDPSTPHTWFNLGIAYKKAADYDRALAQFLRMAQLAPGEPKTHYNLGFLYKVAGKPEEAVREFQEAARLDPGFAAPRFQLYTAYRDAGPARAEDAAREQKTFQDLKKQQAGAAIPEDPEWSYYAEILDPPPAAPDEQKEAPPADYLFEERVAAPSDTSKVRLPAPSLGEGKPDPTTDVAAAGTGSVGAIVLDADADGSPDLLIWSGGSPRLLRGGTQPVNDAIAGAPLSVESAAAGDFDNDGFPDLCLITRDGAALYRNVNGRFERADVSLPPGRYRQTVWLDYDHDYDLDLALIGGTPALVRNKGEAGFEHDQTTMKFAEGEAVAAVMFESEPDTGGHDLLVSYASAPGVMYKDRLGGRYEPREVKALAAGVTALRAEDLDNDGAFDVAGVAGGGLVVLYRENEDYVAVAAGEASAAALTAIDVENRASLDLVTTAGVRRNLPGRRFASGPRLMLGAARALAAADFDRDGRADLAIVDQDGTVRIRLNRTTTPHRWLGVGLTGVRNRKLATGAIVEVKAGARYQKRLYDGVPLVFGLRGQERADTVRITWPNGLIQNEVRQPAGKATVYKEAQRLSGSCPMIFTWNGRGFEFITDVLGVAPLGASAGDGVYFPVDHDEYVQIPGAALAPLNGAYEIRITEELREISYLDHLRLIAVDHPASIEIFTNDKFKSPPFPEFRLFGVEQADRIPPVRATDDHGHDVRGRLLRRDRAYPDDFARTYAGVAEPHALEIDFGRAAPDNRAMLVLNGWVDWADGSTFLGAAQERRELALPSLQVKDREGRWRTVIEDMGLPAGKPKTIVVDLTGKFLSASREVRILTNLCVYWDEIFLAPAAAPPAVRLTPLQTARADLSYRGFSRAIVDPARRQPEHFRYAEWSPTSMWNPTPGMYTRYGDVGPLVRAIDDRLVIMGSGDELKLRFDTRPLPALAAGWTRDFLLLVDGWAKDADANTAFARTVEPLPFHAMPSYPYEGAYPSDPPRRAWQAEYNTRPALRLIRPLTGSPSRPPTRSPSRPPTGSPSLQGRE